MPAKNIVKPYLENAYYHLYNRGVDKREIFLDEQDCGVFLHYLKLYLSPIAELRKENPIGIRIERFIKQNLAKEIDLLAFTLMPNHFHLEVKQYTKDGIVKLMRRVLTSYVCYFNNKYQRRGSLFESSYKAAIVTLEIYLLHLSRYIHLNSRKVVSSINFMNFSSYPYYLGKRQASWVKPQEILGYFKTAQRNGLNDILSYQSFVEDYTVDAGDILGGLVLEEDSDRISSSWQGSTLTKIK